MLRLENKRKTGSVGNPSLLQHGDAEQLLQIRLVEMELVCRSQAHRSFDERILPCHRQSEENLFDAVRYTAKNDVHFVDGKLSAILRHRNRKRQIQRRLVQFDEGD